MVRNVWSILDDKMCINVNKFKEIEDLEDMYYQPLVHSLKEQRKTAGTSQKTDLPSVNFW